MLWGEWKMEAETMRKGKIGGAGGGGGSGERGDAGRWAKKGGEVK